MMHNLIYQEINRCKLITQLDKNKFKVKKIFRKNEHKYPEDFTSHYFNIFE